MIRVPTETGHPRKPGKSKRSAGCRSIKYMSADQGGEGGGGGGGAAPPLPQIPSPQSPTEKKTYFYLQVRGIFAYELSV